MKSSDEQVLVLEKSSVGMKNLDCIFIIHIIETIFMYVWLVGLDRHVNLPPSPSDEELCQQLAAHVRCMLFPPISMVGKSQKSKPLPKAVFVTYLIAQHWFAPWFRTILKAELH